MSLTADQSVQSGMMDQQASLEAGCRLVHDHYQIVYRFALRLSGSHVDAEDLTQQTFLQACRKLEQLRTHERPRPWLFTILRNCYLKSRKKQKQWELPGDEEDWIAQAESEWPEEFDEEQLQLALNEMPEVFRTPVLLYYFEQLNYREISSMLEVPLGTIMSRLARGKELLRSRLQERKETVAFRSS